MGEPGPARVMREPGPNHPIALAPADGRVVVRFAGMVIADSAAALRMRETSLPEVLYVPRGDARMEVLVRSATASHCPYKGEASYYSIVVAGREARDAVWSYENPYPAMAAIGGYLAFYPDRVDAIEVS